MTAQEIPSSGLPSTERLLRGVRDTLRGLSQTAIDDHSRNAITSMDVVLSVLITRQRTELFTALYARAVALVREGTAMLPKLSSVSLKDSLDANMDFRELSANIARAMRSLVDIVEALRGAKTPATLSYLRRVTAFEQELLGQHQKLAAAESASSAQRVITAETLQAYLREKFPEREGLRVAAFKQLVGGYQKTTLLFDVTDDKNNTESMVLRAEKDERFVSLDAGEILREFAIVNIAHAAGIPVAEPLWAEPDASKLGQRFMVSRRVLGENYGTAIAADRPLTPAVAREFIKTLSLIHQVPQSALRDSPVARWLQYPTLFANTAANVEFWLTQPWLKTASPSPAMARLGVWLQDNLPRDDEPPCLLHGDYGIHNVLAKDGVISGVLDWEAARIGDPAEDIAWCLQSSNGQIDGTVALGWYRELTGRSISEYRLRYFDVFNCAKVLVGTASAASMYEAMPRASIEWCNLPLSWSPVITGLIEDKIAAAEAVRSR